MNSLQNFVNWKLTHADKTAEASGYPLVMENCKVNKKMKQLEIYGNSFQDGTPTPETPIEVQSVGELVTDAADYNFGKYKIPVVTKGKNLLKPTSVSAEAIRADRYPRTKNNYGTTIDTTDLSDNSVTVTQISNSNYQPVSYQNGFICILTDGLTVGKKYNISFDIDIHENPLNVTYITLMPGGVASYNISVGSQKRRIGCTFTHALSTQQYAYPFMEIRCMGMSFTASNFMITEVDFDDSFEPYVEPIKTNVFLNEPLRKIGDYADYIDFKSNRVVRKIYKKIYIGSENWTKAGVFNNTDVYRLDDAVPYIGVHPLSIWSNYLVPRWQVDDNDWLVGEVRFQSLEYIPTKRLYLSHSVATAEELKEFLTTKYNEGNPLYLEYPMATPTEELITCILPKLKIKTSIIEVDTNLAPGNAYGKYIKK